MWYFPFQIGDHPSRRYALCHIFFRLFFLIIYLFMKIAITCTCFYWFSEGCKIIIRYTNSPISIDQMKNRIIMHDFQNYKCDLLSRLQGKLLYGMTLKTFRRWNNYCSKNLLWFENIKIMVITVATKMPTMCNIYT